MSSLVHIPSRARSTSSLTSTSMSIFPAELSVQCSGESDSLLQSESIQAEESKLNTWALACLLLQHLSKWGSIVSDFEHDKLTDAVPSIPDYTNLRYSFSVGIALIACRSVTTRKAAKRSCHELYMLTWLQWLKSMQTHWSLPLWLAFSPRFRVWCFLDGLGV